jgi:hypothetical protein
MTLPSPQDYYFGPTGEFDVEFNSLNDTYRAMVISLNKETLELDEITFLLINDDLRLTDNLPVILDNENSNIAFYDMDHDGIYSIGDEFIIDGEIVEPDTYLWVFWIGADKSVMKIEFGE